MNDLLVVKIRQTLENLAKDDLNLGQGRPLLCPVQEGASLQEGHLDVSSEALVEYAFDGNHVRVVQLLQNLKFVLKRLSGFFLLQGDLLEHLEWTRAVRGFQLNQENVSLCVLTVQNADLLVVRELPSVDHES